MSCAGGAGVKVALALVLLVAPACSSSSGTNGSGGSGSAGAGGATNSCADVGSCCTFACEQAPACPAADAGVLGPCMCGIDYQVACSDCATFASDLYKCMMAHQPDGYACAASGSPVFRCGAFCQKEIAAASSACGQQMVDCAQ